MIAYIHGPDRYLAREAARAMVIDLDPDGANTSWLDGRETSLDALVTAVGTRSFFGNTRVVVVSDFLSRAATESSSTADDESDGRPAKANPDLAALAAAVPDEHHLILLEPSSNGPPAALKAVATKIKVVAAEPPRGTALLSWLEAAAARAGSSIQRQAAQRLAELHFPQTWKSKPSNPRYDRPPDMALLSQEIEKLAIAAHPDAIGVSHVDSLVSGSPDQRLFRFIDAALAGDIRTATTELNQLVTAGEEPAMVLAQTLGQIELITIASAANGRDPADIARDLGSISAARMSAVVSSSRRQPDRATNVARAAARLDRRLKTGRLRRPEDALHELIAVLAELPERAPKAGRPE